MTELKKFSIGDLNLTLLTDGMFRLDGGAMFGVIPKKLWERRTESDENNRIPLGLISVLVQSPKENVLIEAGVGDTLDEKLVNIYCIDHKDRLLDCLERAGLKTGDINKVILSHMHFDHIGNSTRKNEAGEFVPTFENAEYIYQKTEWDFAHNPCDLVRASYMPHLFDPIEKSGQLRFIDGDVEITGGIRNQVTGGHTEGHQVLFIESGGEGAIFWGDLIPTSAHVDHPYIMGYDLWSCDTLAAKKKLIPWVIKNDYISIWAHQPTYRYGKIKEAEGKKKYEFEWY